MVVKPKGPHEIFAQEARKLLTDGSWGDKASEKTSFFFF